MRRILAAVLMAGVLSVAACTRSEPGAPTGTPSPPFQGDPPQDAYLYKGETGSYGGTMVLELQTDIGTFNVVRATDNITTYLLWYHVFRCPIDFLNGGAGADDLGRGAAGVPEPGGFPRAGGRGGTAVARLRAAAAGRVAHGGR